MPKITSEVYQITRSPFWHLGRQRDLASLVRFDIKLLRALARSGEENYWTREEEIGNKKRVIVCPRGQMRKLHDTLKGLFGRIEQPDYLYSPRRKHTPYLNAFLHSDSNSIIKIDIKQFYPSTTSEHVFRFFRHHMGMVDDVAGLLTKLCTVNNKLPFGSPLSPVLCSLVHRKLFDRIFNAAKDVNLNGTLWVDDIAISGDVIPSGLLFRIKREIRYHNLRYHKVGRRNIRDGASVTGLYLSNNVIVPMNKTFKKIRVNLISLRNTSDIKEKITLLKSITGQCDYVRTIYPEGHWVRSRIERLIARLHNFRRGLEHVTSALDNTLSVSTRSISVSDEVPWD